jgi:MFS family permease
LHRQTTPHQRAESIGTFRLWRDLGYAIGAIISGITADLFGVNYAIILIGLITIVSSVIIEIRMPKRRLKEKIYELKKPKKIKHSKYCFYPIYSTVVVYSTGTLLRYN